MKIKRFLSTLLAATVCVTSAAFFGGCNTTEVKVDSSRTQLYIGLYEGGVGRAWLDNMVLRFETEYANFEFEPGSGKKGAQVIIDYQKSYDGLSLTTSLPTNNTDEIIFVNGGNYYDFVPYLKDIKYIIDRENPADNNKTIASKLSEDTLALFTVNGGIYALPNWELYNGPCYDAGVFESKNLYFADTIDVADTTWPGTRRFVVNKTAKKSCGPDGVYNTYDDGLPSSIHEFYKLMDKMTKNNVEPFTWTGASNHYTNQLPRSIFQNLGGADAVYAFANFNSRGNAIEIVTGFDSNDRPIIENVVITEENTYKLRQAAGIYYAVEMAQKLYSNPDNFYRDSNFGSFSHLDAMECFLNSGLDGTDHIGMIIDGSWWYNEAYDDGQMERLEYDYPTTYTSKNPKLMPMPVQYSGTVTEGNGKSPVVISGSTGKMLVNGKIKDNHIKIMEEFVSFIYKDSELLEFTKDTSGVYRGVNYDYSSIKGSLNTFAKSVLDIRDAAVAGGTYIFGSSTNPVFLQNGAVLNFGSTEFWASGSDTLMCDAFHYLKGTTQADAVLYFKGMAMDKDVWTNMKG